MSRVPEKPVLDGLETKWDELWQQRGTYRFDRSVTRDQVYSIDTPPPTISGSLHLGTAFGYVQVDAIARFHRMRGKEVFYPMGWDDNGLPTERRVQKYFGVRCDPSMPYDPDLEVAPAESTNSTKSTSSTKEERPVSRKNFIELCHQLTVEFERDFENQWRRLGLSVDWSLTYATIDDRARRVAQRAFLNCLERGEAYASAAPTMWDVDFQTAVAQAEFEDRQVKSAYHRLAFPRIGSDNAGDDANGSSTVEIETTRPELLPSCVALVAHPDDERYQPLFGTDVVTPVFGVRVPVLAHRLADPDKGSGIAMICTFGDPTDVVWWRELNLATRSVLGRDGRFQEATPAWLTGAAALAWESLAGRTAVQARRRVVELLGESGALVGEPRPIVHDVKFYEKGDRPLEIVTSRQWYLRNGARDVELREQLLGRGRELVWHPDFMRLRYEHWVEGLNTDWLVSRQRYFGVPFPFWYRLDEAGEPLWDEPIRAQASALPIDPAGDVPPGFTQAQRGVPGGFIGDPDVMDTWATSSLTPQIAGGWLDDEDLYARVFPNDLRPQGPEIIRTWLFSTVLRSQFEHDVLPWQHTSINGWILDPDRKKMSKSKDNVLTPMPLVDKYGPDGLRYWACKSGPGVDTAADEGQMKIGRRLATKILNAGKFILGLGADSDASMDDVTDPLDLAMLARLALLAQEATIAFEGYEYHRALDALESFFWVFCDDYLELVKDRGYGAGAGAESAKAALAIALSALLRMFAPFLPFVCEEVWSWWQDGSVHRASWPSREPWHAAVGSAGTVDSELLEVVSGVLMEVRKAKSGQHRSQRTEVARLVVADTAQRIALLRRGVDDLRRAGTVLELSLQESASRSVSVDLVPAAQVQTEAAAH